MQGGTVLSVQTRRSNSSTDRHAEHILRRTWRSAIWRSKGRSASARRDWQSDWHARMDGAAVLEDAENPFLADFYNERPGAALQAQLFYLLNRHRQLTSLRQADLFQHTIVCDYVFDRDKIFAYLNLDDNELFIYQRLYDLLVADIPAPDLVVYLQAPTDVLLSRIRKQPVDPERQVPQPDLSLSARVERGVPALLLSLHRDAAARRRNLAVRTRDERRSARRSACGRSTGMGKGTRYYVPRVGEPRSSSAKLAPWRGSRRRASRLPRLTKPAAFPRGCGSSVPTATRSSTRGTSSRPSASARSAAITFA